MSKYQNYSCEENSPDIVSSCFLVEVTSEFRTGNFNWDLSGLLSGITLWSGLWEGESFAAGTVTLGARWVPPGADPRLWPVWPLGIWLVEVAPTGTEGRDIFGLEESSGLRVLTWLADLLEDNIYKTGVRQVGVLNPIRVWLETALCDNMYSKQTRA